MYCDVTQVLLVQCCNSTNIFFFSAFEKFNQYVSEYNTKTPKEKRASYDLVLEYLVSSPQCVEIFDLMTNKDIYMKPEVSGDN